ncbi:MAG: Gmad2 immunoglobulin-like domain-containing protein [Bacillota bacterium]
MKKIVTALLVCLAMAGLCSCSAARKPEQPRNNTIIVPEVSRVNFDTVDLQSAPKVIRDMAKALENRDAAAWGQSGGKAYMIISQGERTKSYEVKVDDVLQRIPEQGFTWLEVKIIYDKRKEPAKSGEPAITVVRADVKNVPQGVGFTANGLDVAGPPVNRPVPRAGPPAAQGDQSAAVIEQPAPNQEVSSPVKVRGTVRAPGQKRLRISTRGGQILKEEIVNPTPGTGAFSAEITYSPPEMATPGEIALIAVSGGDEKILARVPVIIK